jgi:hypothetical protein
MRLGILGPAHGDLQALARGAQFLLDEARVEKVIYLSDDDAMDQVVAAWASGLVEDDPAEGTLFERAAVRGASASADELDSFVEREQARLRLKILVSLPRAPKRTIEILDGRVVLFVHDKAMLDEEDIAAAALLVFGRSAEPLVKRVGARTFLSPGPVTEAGGGRAVLDDTGGGIRVELHDGTGLVHAQVVVEPAKQATRMRVQGGGAPGGTGA